MKRIILLLLALSMATAGFAQAQPSDKPLFGVFVDGKEAFIDATGQIVISVPFEHVEPFSEGLAMAFDAGRFGYIDTTGKVVIPLRFAIASCFSQGLAAVSIASQTWKWGFIDRTGRMVIEPQFDQTGDFSEGLALVRVGELLRYIDPSGRVAIDLHERRLPNEVNLTDARHFSHGLAAFSAPDTAKWGFMDKSGKAVIPPRFDAVDSFHEGLALVTLDGHHGYIDTTGAMVLELPSDRTGSPFSQGLAAVKVGDKFGYMDVKGTMVIAPGFGEAKEFVADRASVKIGNAVGYIDKTGSLAIPAYFEEGKDFVNGLARVSPGARCSEYIDRDGHVVWRNGGTAKGMPCAEAVVNVAPPIAPPIAPAGSPLEIARTAVTEGEAVEAARRVNDLHLEALNEASVALDAYRKLHPDDVETLLLAARLGRLQELGVQMLSAPLPEIGRKREAEERQRAHLLELQSLVDRVVKLEPGNAAAHYWNARLFGFSNRTVYGAGPEPGVWDVDRAILSAKKAVELAPDVVAYREALASVLVIGQKFDEAVAALAPGHPMSILLQEMAQVPVPKGAVAVRALARNMADTEAAKGRLADYPYLRVRAYAVGGSASQVEAFYRDKWPGFRFYKGEGEDDEGGFSMNFFMELLRFEGSKLVPFGGGKKVANVSPAELTSSMAVMVLEARNMTADETPWIALLPESERKLNCLINILDYRSGH